MFNAAQQWFQSREAREQRVLKWGALASLVIIVGALWLSLQQRVNAAQQRLETKQADLQWLQQVAPRLAAAGPAPTPPTNESLVVLIDRSARESGLAESITGSQPSTGGGLRVQLQQAEFNALVAWLSRLNQQHGLRIETVSLEAATAGRVNATVSLAAS